MTRKYYGWIAYEDVHGCHEEGVTEETLEEFEEKYGRIVDSGGGDCECACVFGEG